MDHLVLIDGHHLMYRAYWAIPRTLRTSTGEQNNAVFGVASMLMTILQQEKSERLLFCFDAGDETFRHQEVTEFKKFGEYKEGRAETPDDFYTQIPRILQLIDAFSICSVSDPKYEADDFLCTYAHAAVAEGMRVTVVTGDRDAFQLANDKIRIAIPHKGYQQAEYLDAAGVLAKFGVRPDQVPSYKGLCGDSSDNLPGVQGIGPKNAAKLLQDFDSLDGIYENLDKIRPAIREKLERDKEQAFFCQRMAQLICDIPLPVPLDDLILRDLPASSVINFFQEMEFTLLSKRLRTFLETDYGKRVFRSDDLPSQPVMVASSSKEYKEEEDQLPLFD